jgi:ATP-dependent 26S proteasome regulatory subunit
LLVATTNVESSLDSALFRRFDEVFFVPLPSPTEVDKLLRVTLSSVRLAEMINWERIVEQLSGASAAMVVKAAQDAAKAAVLGEKKGVTESHLLQAVAELRRNENSVREE